MALSRPQLYRVAFFLIPFIVICAFFAASWQEVPWSYFTHSGRKPPPKSSQSKPTLPLSSSHEHVQDHNVDRLPVYGYEHGVEDTESRPLVAQYGGACRGARGFPLREGLTDDLPAAVFDLDGQPYPDATYGSWEAVGLEQSWMTFEDRYRPYGYGEDDADYPFSRVDWERLDWGRLQDECALAQTDIYYHGRIFSTPGRPRMGLHNPHIKRPTKAKRTGRQAIVIRVWDSYRWTPEDTWNIRSIITEAGLATRSKYTVVLLVDVKRKDGKQIYEAEEFYRHVLGEAVPAEFQSIAVLYHASLLENWYSKVAEHRPRWQIMQPLQLFANFYPEFDHFWQFDMDVRFTGHAGKMLQGFHHFGRNQPYKQSRERASWTYMPAIHGTYQEFSASINQSLAGGATTWWPLPGIGDFDSIGPKLKFATPEEDVKFRAGVDVDPDVLILNPLVAVDHLDKFKEWPFTDWFREISENLPKFMSLPAQGRASRELLELIHKAQRENGMALPGEATLPSFAIWNGGQVVQVPLPQFVFPERDLNELNQLANGGMPADFADGIANATLQWSKPKTQWSSALDAASSIPDVIFQRWRTGDPTNPGRAENLGGIPDGIPSFMREVNGKVYAPALILHPTWTNDRKKFHYEI